MLLHNRDCATLWSSNVFKFVVPSPLGWLWCPWKVFPLLPKESNCAKTSAMTSPPSSECKSGLLLLCFSSTLKTILLPSAWTSATVASTEFSVKALSVPPNLYDTKLSAETFTRSTTATSRCAWSPVSETTFTAAPCCSSRTSLPFLFSISSSKSSMLNNDSSKSISISWHRSTFSVTASSSMSPSSAKASSISSSNFSIATLESNNFFLAALTRDIVFLEKSFLSEVSVSTSFTSLAITFMWPSCLLLTLLTECFISAKFFFSFFSDY